MISISPNLKRFFCARRLVLLSIWVLTSTAASAESNRTSEQAGLDGLLSVIEAQTRFAYRNGRYAASIAELGFQSSVMSAGQLASQEVFAADYDRPQKVANDGYYFRILPVRGEDSKMESNSFWAVALPAEDRDDLPVFVTVAYRIGKVDYPLVNWWAIRLHTKSREAVARLFQGSASAGINDIGLNPETPEAFASGTVVRRFLLDPQLKYSPVERLKPVTKGSRSLPIAAGIFIVLILIFFPKWSKKKRT